MKNTRPTFLIISAIILNACTASTTPSTTPPTNIPVSTTVPAHTATVETAPTFTQVEGALTIDIGLSTESQHLILDVGGDVDTESVMVGEPAVPARRSGNGMSLAATDGNPTPDSYIQFRVDNAVLFEAQPAGGVFIEVEYLDDGADTFNIQYDGETGGPFGDGRFKNSYSIYKTNSGRFKTVGFVLKDIFFGDRDNGADFRITDNLDGAETVRRVQVTLLMKTQVINVDTCGANPLDDQPDSDAIQTCIDKARWGDTVTFTSGVDTSGYKGYLINKTIFLVKNMPLKYVTFTSTDPKNPALLKATAELKGFVAQLFARSRIGEAGKIDYITINNLNFDGGRDIRSCFGSDGKIDGNNDNWGSWLPECTVSGDSWCSPGTLNFFGAMNEADLYQNYKSAQDQWTTGLLIESLRVANTECGTAMGMGGAGNFIINNTIETAGDHVHAAGCALTDKDEASGSWSDGLTMSGPGHFISGNTIINPSDVGIVFFGGRETIVRDNTIRVTSGNYGAFAGIAIHPWGIGDVAFMRVENNTVTSSGDEKCGGIHAGINIGTHMWGGGCTYNGSAVSVGNAICSQEPPAPQGALCATNTTCQKWAYVPDGTTFTLQNNSVDGAHINYLVEGLDLSGSLEDINNISVVPRKSDWESANFGCNGTFWKPTDKIAHHPSLTGWTDIPIHCER